MQSEFDVVMKKVHLAKSDVLKTYLRILKLTGIHEKESIFINSCFETRGKLLQDTLKFFLSTSTLRSEFT